MSCVDRPLCVRGHNVSHAHMLLLNLATQFRISSALHGRNRILAIHIFWRGRQYAPFVLRTRTEEAPNLSIAGSDVGTVLALLRRLPPSTARDTPGTRVLGDTSVVSTIGSVLTSDERERRISSCCPLSCACVGAPSGKQTLCRSEKTTKPNKTHRLRRVTSTLRL